MWTCDRWILVDKASTIGVSPLSLNRLRPPIEACKISNTIVCYCIVMHSIALYVYLSLLYSDKTPTNWRRKPMQSYTPAPAKGAQKIKKGGLAQKYKFSRNIKRLAACTISILLETTNYQHRQTIYCFRSWYFSDIEPFDIECNQDCANISFSFAAKPRRVLRR